MLLSSLAHTNTCLKCRQWSTQKRLLFFSPPQHQPMPGPFLPLKLPRIKIASFSKNLERRCPWPTSFGYEALELLNIELSSWMKKTCDTYMKSDFNHIYQSNFLPFGLCITLLGNLATDRVLFEPLRHLKQEVNQSPINPSPPHLNTSIWRPKDGMDLVQVI